MNLFGFDISLKRSIKGEPDWDREVDQKIKNSFILPWEQHRPLSQTANYAALIAAYKSWVYICANKNATAVADANLKVYVKKASKDQKTHFNTKTIEKSTLARLKKIPSLSRVITKDSSIEEVEEHPLYDLFNKVNPFISRFDLWEMTTLFLEMTGNAYWYIVRDENFGIPIQIWILPSQYVQVVVSREKFVSGYVLTRGVEKIPFTEEEIIHFKYPSMSSIFYGQGCLMAAIDAHDFEQSTKQFETTLMKNQGRPEGILQTEQGLTDIEFNRMQEQWDRKYGVAGRKGKPLILERGLKYTPLTMTPKEIGFILGRKLAREEIAAVFGVPISKLTTEKVNLANAFIGERQYMADTISPRLRRIEEKINERLMPMYDEKVFVVYDEVIPEDKEFMIKERESNLKTMMTTINQEREKINLDPVKWGDVPMVQPGMAPLGSAQQQANGSMQNANTGGEGNPEDLSDEDLDNELAALEEEEANSKKEFVFKGGEGSGVRGHTTPRQIRIAKLRKEKDSRDISIYALGNTNQREHVKPIRKAEDQAAFIAKESNIPHKEALVRLQALRYFTDGGFTEIRNGKNKESAEAIESFIKGSPKWPEEKSLFRGVNTSEDFISSLSVGGGIDMKGISSWSSEEGVAKKFTKAGYATGIGSAKEQGSGAIFILKKSKNSTAVSHLSEVPHESEVVLSGKVKLKVTSIKKGVPNIIEIEEIGANSKIYNSIFQKDFFIKSKKGKQIPLIERWNMDSDLIEIISSKKKGQEEVEEAKYIADEMAKAVVEAIRGKNKIRRSEYAITT